MGSGDLADADAMERALNENSARQRGEFDPPLELTGRQRTIVRNALLTAADALVKVDRNHPDAQLMRNATTVVLPSTDAPLKLTGRQRTIVRSALLKAAKALAEARSKAYRVAQFVREASTEVTHALAYLPEPAKPQGEPVAADS